MISSVLKICKAVIVQTIVQSMLQGVIIDLSDFILTLSLKF